MSVLKIIAANRATLSQFIIKPDPSFRVDIRVPPGPGSPQKIGGAFDYALRIGLAKRFSTTDGPFLASSVPAELVDNPHIPEDIASRAAKLLQNVETTLESFADDPGLPPPLASACFDLAGLDVVRRRGVTSGLYDAGTPAEVDELCALYDIVPWDDFEPEELLALNPHFNKGSWIVLGADADIVLDGAVLEVKTTKNPNPKLDFFRQVACYAVLADEYGLNENAVPVDVRDIGFYLSRAGQIVTWPMDDCVPPAGRTGLLEPGSCSHGVKGA